MNKVAKITFYLWVMKICATTLGETAGDLLSMMMNVGYAISSLILLGFFLYHLYLSLDQQSFILYFIGLLSWQQAQQAQQCLTLWIEHLNSVMQMAL